MKQNPHKPNVVSNISTTLRLVKYPAISIESATSFSYFIFSISQPVDDASIACSSPSGRSRWVPFNRRGRGKLELRSNRVTVVVKLELNPNYYYLLAMETAASIPSNPRTLEEVFRDYRGRRTAIVRALTTGKKLFIFILKFIVFSQKID